MKRPNNIENEIDRIRLKIYEENKGLTLEEQDEKTGRIADAVVKKYGLRRVTRA